jgi:hypothetical protein
MFLNTNAHFSDLSIWFGLSHWVDFSAENVFLLFQLNYVFALYFSASSEDEQGVSA